MTWGMTISMSNERHAASFRDPSGFLFTHEGVLYRQINQRYAEEYDHLLASGLYDNLIKIKRLIPHSKATIATPQPDQAYTIIQPEPLPFISYPYEWAFSQLKEAALVTLSIQKRALKVGMSLKDASAYNIQFHQGKAVLIDTLSFEFYDEGQPWVAYKQFCQHFLAPLALMAKTDIRLSQLLRTNIDGIPIDLASKLLPGSTRLNPGLMMHIHMHARAQREFADHSFNSSPKTSEMSQRALLGIIDSLKNTIQKLKWKPSGTEWEKYYDITNYSEAGFTHKKDCVTNWVRKVKPKQVCDLGANNGAFSRLAAEQGAYVVSYDIDPAAVEKNYQQMKAGKETHLLPLILDLTNPSPAIGWQNHERESFMERAPADMVLALALVHHLAISNNLPLPQLAQFFSELGQWLVVEFVPKSDEQVKKLLQSREDIFDDYAVEAFEAAFEASYHIHQKENVQDSERCIYLMEKR